jgi:hypothetical protein
MPSAAGAKRRAEFLLSTSIQITITTAPGAPSMIGATERCGKDGPPATHVSGKVSFITDVLRYTVTVDAFRDREGKSGDEF